MEGLWFWNGPWPPNHDNSSPPSTDCTKSEERPDSEGGPYKERATSCNYCGNCLMLVTRSPMKRTKTVFDGGWP
jgi:hypothetical protein